MESLRSQSSQSLSCQTTGRINRRQAEHLQALRTEVIPKNKIHPEFSNIRSALEMCVWTTPLGALVQTGLEFKWPDRTEKDQNTSPGEELSSALLEIIISAKQSDHEKASVTAVPVEAEASHCPGILPWGNSTGPWIWLGTDSAGSLVCSEQLWQSSNFKSIPLLLTQKIFRKTEQISCRFFSFFFYLSAGTEVGGNSCTPSYVILESSLPCLQGIGYF